MPVSRSLVLALLTAAAPAAVHAQSQAPQPAAAGVADVADDTTVLEELVITAAPRGAVIGDIAPEIQLDAVDIQAYGASNLSELLEALAPQTRSGRGRGGEAPVVLLNGRRISGFSEIRGIPPEAILRVDILPEEVALKYGYRADQRVVNFVLRERFQAVTAEVEGGRPTAGGRAESEIELNLLRIDSTGRFSFEIEHERSSPILESERDLLQADAEAPYSLAGAIASTMLGAEIDPALSGLAGRTLTVAGVPASAAGGIPALNDFAGATASAADITPYRSLTSAEEQTSFNTTFSRNVFGDVSATINARLDLSESRSLLGLPEAELLIPAESPFSPFSRDVSLYRYIDAYGPLMREEEEQTGRLGFAANGRFGGGGWRWSLTGNYDQTDTVVRTDTGVDTAAVQGRVFAADATLNPFGALGRDVISPAARDRAWSSAQTASTELVINGSPFSLPAGDVSTTFRGQADTRRFRSETTTDSVDRRTDLSADRGSFQANIDLPLTSRRNEILPLVGDLTLNANAEVETSTAFGTLRTLGGGLNWSPVERLELIASVTDEDGAPSLQQLGNPVIETPNVPVFDFAAGETIEVIRIDGGNPGLVADNRRVLKLGATFKPFEESDLSISANYVRTRINNPIAGFPSITPEIEAAFPDRFVRDATGRLVSFDARPVNFARSDREELRWGFNYSRRLGPAAPEGGRGVPGGRPPGERRTGAGGGQGGPGGGFRGPGGRFGGRPGEGRLQFAVYHTWHLQDSILIRDGVPELDLLNGSAVGSTGGQPEHEIEVQAGVFKNGFGLRADANWRSGTFVRGETNATATNGDLFFSDLTTVNVRLFADLGQQRKLVQAQPWLRGSRVSLVVDNLFDSRLDVRDTAGVTPIGYQPAYLDPVGRSVRLSFRKLLF